MSDSNRREELLDGLDAKFKAVGRDAEPFLEGLQHAKLLTYWDYVQTDVLLNLQTQRTVFPDEMVFITYHQINELLFKLILWELKQVAEQKNLSATFFEEKLSRASRYFDMLTTSFTIMRDGMDPKQYEQFRHTLTPASGFQSVQYRYIELASTELINLIDLRFRQNIDRNTPYEYAFEHMYWQAAGKDYKTGKKSILLKNFEDRYKDDLLERMSFYNTKNLWSRFKSLPEADQQNSALVNTMRHYDRTVNITWVMAHYNTAKYYIEGDGKAGEATGGSDWKKYMHPKYQKRIFFPQLWTDNEIENWGVDV